MVTLYRSTQIWAVCLAASITVGCRTSQHNHLPTTDGLQAPLRHTEPVIAAQLYPLSTRSGLMNRQLGANQPTTIGYHLDKMDENQWRLTFEGVRVVHLQRNANGAITIPREEELTEAVAVTYEPPLVMLPPQLTIGQPLQQKVRMTVNRLKDGSIQNHGWCSYRLERLGDQTLVTPAGTFEAVMVQTHRQIDLQMAQVQVTTQTAYAVDRGLVFKRIGRVTRPMKLFEIKQTEELQLVR